jgi:hypothetical protein
VSPACRASLLRPGQALADAGALVVAPPAEAGLVWLRLERRARKVARRKLQVVLHRGEVVRTIGMEKRSQVLELPTSRTCSNMPPPYAPMPWALQ